eukprot:m.38130 g.38130  ORF g.38130 m.38130 type:complete len:625 (-) comp10159_c0_seq1:1879-3753(-)
MRFGVVFVYVVSLCAAAACYVAAVKDNAFLPRIEPLERLARAARAHRPVGADIQTFYMTMRDGVRLWTGLIDLHPPNVTVPTVLLRSPYGADGTENLDDLFLPFGFNVVQQNQRGTGQSQGNFSFWDMCPNDEEDTISWIIEQPWSNGQVYVMGASADGINSYLGMRKPQRELGQWFIFATGEAHKVPFQNGALKKHLAYHWLQGMQDYRPSAPNYFNDTLLPHEANSPWWSQRNLSNYDTITFPAVHWGGWYDIFGQLMIDTYTGYRYASAAPLQQRLVMGPRGHCLTEHPLLFPDDRLGDIWAFESALSIFKNGTFTEQERATLASIAAKVLSDTEDGSLSHAQPMSAHLLKNVTLYIMGPAREGYPTLGVTAPQENVTGLYWTTLDDFPSTTPLTMFMDSARKELVQQPPPSSSSLSYDYDPSNPVKTIGGNNLYLACGPHDQRPAENRSDVLVFTSTPLTEDMPIVGRIKFNLFVSSNRNDTDFTVKVTDVYPLLRGEASILISDDIVRMRWRNGMDAPVAMEAGKVYNVQVELWTTAYIFNAGHRVRVAISSSNSDRFATNPNNGLPLDQDGPILIAHNTVYFGGSQASSVTFPTVTLDQIPANIKPVPFEATATAQEV